MSKYRAMLYYFSHDLQHVWQLELDSAEREDIFAQIRAHFLGAGKYDITFSNLIDRDETFVYSKDNVLLGWVILENFIEGWHIQFDDGRYSIIKDSGLITFTSSLEYATLFKSYEDAQKLRDLVMDYAPQRMAYIKSSSIWRTIK